MALNQDCSTALISRFQGATPSQDPYEVDPAHGLYCQNCDFFQGLNQSVQVSTRRGFSQVALFSGEGTISSLASWYFSLSGAENCYAVYYSYVHGVKAWDQDGQAFVGPFGSHSGINQVAYVAFDGVRIYMAYCVLNGRQAPVGAEIYQIGVGGPDPLFPVGTDTTTVTITPSQSTVSGHNVTVGPHNIVVFWTSRSGYFGSFYFLSPASIAVTGTAYQFTNSAVTGTNNTITLTMTVNSPLPSWFTGGTLQFAMTTASNPARYFLIPGISSPIPAVGVPTVVATIGISDNDLVLGTDVTQNQNFAGSGLSAPFLPSALFQYSSRMGYVTKDAANFPVIYFSQQNAYQSVSLAFGAIYLEGRQIPVQGVSLGGTCYIATLSGLYATQDNGDYPATWNPPAHIDGSVGVLAPSCILCAGGKILLASEKGLYLFRGGAFPQLPISYFQDHDWNRINWNLPAQVQIVDDTYSKVLRVLAPLKALVTFATNTAGIIQITTAILINNVPVAVPHLFANGTRVEISGVPGNTGANGLFVIFNAVGNQFDIAASGTGNYIPDPQGWAGTVTPDSPNAVMTWAYPGGDAIYETFYSLHGFSSFNPGSMSTVRNIRSGVDETWIAPTGDGPLIRRVLPTDGLIHRDLDMSGNPAAISSLYETSLIPGSQDEQMTFHDYHGVHLRATGQGPLNLTVFSLDHQTSLIPLASPIALTQQPGSEYLIKWFLRSNQETLQFGTNLVDAYFVMALLRFYYTNSLPQR